VQFLHAAPPVPHFPLLLAPLATQVVPEQQPWHWLAQSYPVLQACVVASQLSDPEHTVHAPPPFPQAVLVVPGLQVLPLQHPLAQEAALQTHCPFAQSWLAAHGTHAAPVSPHCFLVLLGGLTQVLPSQQPP
jgi:hypothetical protein